MLQVNVCEGCDGAFCNECDGCDGLTFGCNGCGEKACTSCQNYNGMDPEGTCYCPSCMHSLLS